MSNRGKVTAGYIAQHCDVLSEYIDKKSMQFLEIELLSRAGLADQAKTRLRNLQQEGLSESDQIRLTRTIAEVEGIDPIEIRRKQFEKTDSLEDLFRLLDEIENSSAWNDLCVYGEIAFDRTGSLRDALRLATAYANTSANQQLVNFVESNVSLLDHSSQLRLMYAWALYERGALTASRAVLAKIEDLRIEPTYRALRVSLGIALGDWESLLSIVAGELSESDARTAEELISAAQLALSLDSPNAKTLTYKAAQKGHDNATVFAAAYFLASSAGWEHEPGVIEWLHKAAGLSGVDGPIRAVTLKEILDLKPEWDRHESETWSQLSRGEIPLFVAATALKKSLLSLTLIPAYANLSENDPRRRGSIPAFAGSRAGECVSELGSGSIGVDASALVTLSFLDLLGTALDTFDTIRIPHATLGWLFEEKRNIAFHQPSLIRDAHRLQHLVATGELGVLTQGNSGSSELTAQIGEELASLITEAQDKGEEEGSQHVVIRSRPVHRIGSLMDEEADLHQYAPVLSSCHAVIDKLKRLGQITSEEERKAYAYLTLHEKQWPNQPALAVGAVLYLDELSVNYLMHLGVLHKLTLAGFKPFVTTRTRSEANSLVAYENLFSDVNKTIERIRDFLRTRIESGKIHVGERIQSSRSGAGPGFEHPSLGIVAMVSEI